MDEQKSRQSFAMYMRNFIFGVEDSLVSTVGLLSGVAVANVPRGTIFLTGIVLIFVEAFSMAVGSLLSEHSAEEYIKRADVPIKNDFAVAAVMFFSYFVSGFIPLAPYVVFSSQNAFWFSILATLVSLFILGVISARIFKLNLLRSGVRMLVIGGIAVGVGIMVGMFVRL